MSQLYCPKCANQAVPGQRFCRNCGTNLGAILDAMEGKRGPLDFESLKRDLRDLGSSLRAGFEEASAAIKRTQKLSPQPAPAGQPSQVVMPSFSREVEKALRKVKAAHTRKYSLQQATLSIFGGGVWMAVWYQLLNTAADSGLLRNLELIITEKTEAPVFGLVQVIQMLWLLGLIPVARGVAHLINGIFFAPKAEKETEAQPLFAQSYIQPQPNYVSSVAGITTSELENEQSARPQSSVTEDATLRFEPK
jgi:hypothetical protein